MREVTAKELSELDPKRFEKEYHSWVEHHWWEGTETISDYIKNVMSPLDWDIDPKDVSWSGFWSQGDGLAFDGKMSLSAFMERRGYKESHYALWLDIESFGDSLIRVERGGYGRGNYFVTEAGLDDYSDNDFSYGEPAGIYENLPQEAWEELLQLQYDEIMDEILDEAHKEAVEHARQMYKALDADYEYSTSEEQFIESCEWNEITFTVEEDEHETTN